MGPSRAEVPHGRAVARIDRALLWVARARMTVREIMDLLSATPTSIAIWKGSITHGEGAHLYLLRTAMPYVELLVSVAQAESISESGHLRLLCPGPRLKTHHFTDAVNKSSAAASVASSSKQHCFFAVHSLSELGQRRSVGAFATSILQRLTCTKDLV